MTRRSRNWCLTINNPTDDDVNNFQDLDWENAPGIKYMVIGFEHFGPAPKDAETWTRHLQIFIQYTNEKSFKQVYESWPHAHIEPAKGTPGQAADYCKKEQFVEYGTVPKSAKQCGIEQKERWERTRKLAMEDRVDEIDDEHYIRYYSTVNRIASQFRQPVRTLTWDEVTFQLYYGATGTGKTSQVYSDYFESEIYEKNPNKWWDSYKGQKCVLIDELRPDCAKALQTHFKKWLNIAPFQAEIKGGTIRIRPQIIIITSNYSLEQLWGYDQEGAYLPMKRRLKCTHFKTCRTEKSIQAVKRRRIERGDHTSESIPTEKKQKQTSNEED